MCVWGRSIHHTDGSVTHIYTDTQSHETHLYNTQTLRSLTGLHGVWGVHQNLGRQVYEVHYGYPGYTGGGEDGGGSVSGRWSLVANAEILGCPGPTVPSGWRYVWYFGTRGLWCVYRVWIFGFSDSIGTSGKQKSSDSIGALLRYPWIFGSLRCLALPGIRRSGVAKNNRALGAYASRMVFQV